MFCRYMMAITFKITNGDAEFNDSTGRPKTLGNEVGEEDKSRAKEKATQDVRRGLSINRLLTGDSAAINELAGIEQDGGMLSVQGLLSRNIIDMHSNLIRLQRLRPNVRPISERFAKITFLQIIRDASKVSLRFRIDFQTISGLTISQTGTISTSG